MMPDEGPARLHAPFEKRGPAARPPRAVALLRCLLLLCLAWSGLAQAQIAPPLACDSRMWLSQANRLSLVDTSASPVTFPTALTITQPGTQHFLNAGDINPADGSLYYIRNAGNGNAASNQLWRISGNGTTTNLGTVGSLPVAGAPIGQRTYISGAFTAAGNILYVLHNQSPQAQMYAIDVNASPLTATLIPFTSSISVADIAYTNGAFYAVQLSGQMVRIDLDGTVSNIGAPNGLTNGSHVGGMMGAPNGLFGIHNAGGFYQFDVTTGAAVQIGPATASDSNDGYHCPSSPLAFGADLAVTKTNTPASGPNDLANDTYVPGQARTYDIVVRNNGPFGAQNQPVVDTLPAGITAATWTCAVNAGSPAGTSCGETTSGSVSGATTINWPGLDLPVGGAVTFRVTLTAPLSYTGTLVNSVQVLPTDSVIDNTPGNNSATDSDLRAPQVTLRKTTIGGVGSFSFSGGNGVANHTITTTAENTAVTGAAQFLTTPGTATAITEAVPAGWRLTDITCTGLPSGGGATVDLAAATVTLNAAATVVNAQVQCTFTNTRQPIVRLQKSLPNGRFDAADQFTLAIAGPGAPAAVTTTGSGSTAAGSVLVSPAAIGSAYALSETGAGATNLAAHYTSAWSCTNAHAGGQAPSGSGTSFSVTPVAGDDLTCTFANTRSVRADLSITKTNTPGQNGDVDLGGDTLLSGSSTTYTLRVANAGPDAAHGATVRDTPANLSCSSISCSASGGAQCPVSLDVGLLTTSGLVLPALPVGGNAVFTLTCTVP